MYTVNTFLDQIKVGKNGKTNEFHVKFNWLNLMHLLQICDNFRFF